MDKTHPLYGAQLRFERADRHLAEATTVIEAFSRACVEHLLTNDQGHISRLSGWPPIPSELPVVISDAIP